MERKPIGRNVFTWVVLAKGPRFWNVAYEGLSLAYAQELYAYFQDKGIPVRMEQKSSYVRDDGTVGVVDYWSQG